MFSSACACAQLHRGYCPPLLYFTVSSISSSKYAGWSGPSLPVFKKWILFFFSKFIEVWPQWIAGKVNEPQWVACKVNEHRRGSFTLHATHCGHTSINFGKNQVPHLYLHYFSRVPWRELHITGCIKGRQIIFGELKSGDVNTTVAASNQISESVS